MRPCRRRCHSEGRHRRTEESVIPGGRIATPVCGLVRNDNTVGEGFILPGNEAKIAAGFLGAVNRSPTIEYGVCRIYCRGRRPRRPVGGALVGAGRRGRRPLQYGGPLRGVGDADWLWYDCHRQSCSLQFAARRTAPYGAMTDTGDDGHPGRGVPTAGNGLGYSNSRGYRAGGGMWSCRPTETGM